VSNPLVPLLKLFSNIKQTAMCTLTCFEKIANTVKIEKYVTVLKLN